MLPRLSGLADKEFGTRSRETAHRRSHSPVGSPFSFRTGLSPVGLRPERGSSQRNHLQRRNAFQGEGSCLIGRTKTLIGGMRCHDLSAGSKTTPESGSLLRPSSGNSSLELLRLLCSPLSEQEVKKLPCEFRNGCQSTGLINDRLASTSSQVAVMLNRGACGRDV